MNMLYFFHIEPLGHLANLDMNRPKQHSVEEWFVKKNSVEEWFVKKKTVLRNEVWKYRKISSFSPLYRWWWTWRGERPNHSGNPEASSYNLATEGSRMSFWRPFSTCQPHITKTKTMYITMQACSLQEPLSFRRVLLLVSGGHSKGLSFWRNSTDDFGDHDLQRDRELHGEIASQMNFSFLWEEAKVIVMWRVLLGKISSAPRT